MPQYKVENHNIKGGFFSNAEDRIEKLVQPFLDAGSGKGWILHTLQATEASKGINLVFVWQVG